MDLYYRVKIRTLIYDKFGRDISTIIIPYLQGDCCICNKTLMKYNICESCDKVYCNDCLQFKDVSHNIINLIRKYSEHFDYCFVCLNNMILNDN